MPLLLALSLAYALGQSPAPSSASAISGQVVEDVTRAPIAGAEVTLLPMRSRPSDFPPIGDRPKMVTTDGNGRYVFQDVEPGRYQINVNRAGFTRIGDAGMPDTTVVAGQSVSGVDVTLQRGAVITGRVLDADGHPLADANVMAMRRPPAFRGGPGMRPGGPAVRPFLVPAGGSTQTNDLGEFRLHSLQPGELYVQAMARGGFAPSAGAGASIAVPTHFPNTPDAASAQPIHVAAGQTVGNIDIFMAYAPAFRVSGVVIDENGRPVPNARVTLSAADSNRGPMFMMGRANDSRTDARGNFEISGVTGGAYTLIAMPPVLISRAPDRAAGAGAASSFGMSAGGFGGHEVMTETRDGTTIQYRSDMGTRVSVAVAADVQGLEIAVRTPPR